MGSHPSRGVATKGGRQTNGGGSSSLVEYPSGGTPLQQDGSRSTSLQNHMLQFRQELPADATHMRGGMETMMEEGREQSRLEAAQKARQRHQHQHGRQGERFEPELISNPNTTIIMCDVVDPSDIIHHTEDGGMALVRTLREIFSEFALLAEEHNVRKIRAINDTWLGVSGMDGDPLHAENAMRMSWRMVQVARDMDVPIRIGVHTGALMSGIISRNAPFDVWGVSLKEAGLMLALCPPMRVNVSPSTYPLVQFSFPFETREISIDQERGKTFYVLADEQASVVNAGQGSSAADGRGEDALPTKKGLVTEEEVAPRILVVDDNATTRKAVQRMLQSMNCSAFEAKDGEEAISVLGHLWPLDIIFMDIEMPRMNGWDATEHIRFHLQEPIRSVPIVALTAHATADDVQRCLEEGMDDFMTKPIKPTLLLKMVEKWVKNFSPDTSLPVAPRRGQGKLGIVEGVATPSKRHSVRHQQQQHHTRTLSGTSHQRHASATSTRTTPVTEGSGAAAVLEDGLSHAKSSPLRHAASTISGVERNTGSTGKPCTLSAVPGGTLLFSSSGDGTGTGTGTGEEEAEEGREPVRRIADSTAQPGGAEAAAGSGSAPSRVSPSADVTRRDAVTSHPKMYPYCWGEGSVTGAATSPSTTSDQSGRGSEAGDGDNALSEDVERRILVCDDSDLTRKMVVRMLKRFHCQVVDVVNGAEGVQQIQENGPFHVVFMDIHMPVMDGFAATRAIRALPPPLCDIPIVAITAYTTRDDSDRYLEAGMNDFVCKPLKVSVIKDLLEKFLDLDS